jgi:hypothetical protein
LLLVLDAPITVTVPKLLAPPLFTAAGCLVPAGLSAGSEELPLPLPPELSLRCDAVPSRAFGS